MYSDDKTVYSGKVSRDAYIKYVLETYSQMIIRLCFTYVKNICDAEDIAQDVFVSLMKHEKTFDNSEHEKAWLLRTAMNKSKNHLKSGWVSKTVQLDDAEADTSEAEITDATEKSNVLEAVLSLPEKYRTVIHLFYYNGYSINEISDIINKKPATVGTLLARGRAILKKMMIGGFEDE